MSNIEPVLTHQHPGHPPVLVKPLLLTVDQAATVLSVSPRTVWRLIESQKLTPRRIGRAVRVLTSQVEAMANGE